jgi:hypothetical protein
MNSWVEHIEHMGRRKSVQKFLLENLKRPLEDLGVDGRIILQDWNGVLLGVH